MFAIEKAEKRHKYRSARVFESVHDVSTGGCEYTALTEVQTGDGLLTVHGVRVQFFVHAKIEDLQLTVLAGSCKVSAEVRLVR